MNRLAALFLISVLALTAAAQAAPGTEAGGATKPAPAAQTGAKQPDGTIGFQPLPNVQIFSSQPAVNLRLGAAPKVVALSGAVYGRTPFMFGSITVTPNVPNGQSGQTACPVYVSGTNLTGLNPPSSTPLTTLAANANFTVYVTLQAMPGMAARSRGNCTLKYSALDQTANGPFESGSGNQVTVPYTIVPAK